MDIQLQFAMWDVLASIGQTLAMFCDAFLPGLLIIICLSVVFRMSAGPQRENSPSRFRRRRYRNLWDD